MVKDVYRPMQSTTVPSHRPSADVAAPSSTIADPNRVRALLVAAALEGRGLSYSELLGRLGHRFTRPKMRALCNTLGAIDDAGVVRGEPSLAVLVVRQKDGLPGHGWWASSTGERGYFGPWSGPDAVAFVRSIQDEAFVYWRAAKTANGRARRPKGRLAR